MPITYRVDLERRVVHIRVTERPTVEEVVDYVDRMLREETLPEDFVEIIDFREADMSDLDY